MVAMQTDLKWTTMMLLCLEVSLPLASGLCTGFASVSDAAVCCVVFWLQHPVLDDLCRCVKSLVYSVELLRDIKRQVNQEIHQRKHFKRMLSSACLDPESSRAAEASSSRPAPVKHILNKSDMRVAKMLFNKADKDNTRTLSKKQLGLLLQDLYLPMEDAALTTLFAKLDEDNRGSIDFVEFCEFVYEYEAIPEEKRPTIAERRARSRANSMALSTAEFNTQLEQGREDERPRISPVKGIAALAH